MRPVSKTRRTWFPIKFSLQLQSFKNYLSNLVFRRLDAAVLNVNLERDGVGVYHTVFVQLDQHQRGLARICQAALVEQGIAQAVEDKC